MRRTTAVWPLERPLISLSGLSAKSPTHLGARRGLCVLTIRSRSYRIPLLVSACYPYGNLPRLILAWVSTEAVRTQSRVLILGSSLSEFMRTLGMEDRSGSPRGDRTRLRNQMDRLFHSHVQLIYEDEQHKASVSSQVADRTDLWWNPKRPDEPSLWDSKILLSEAFFNEIVSHPVPLDMNTLKALKRCALGLDLYLGHEPQPC